MNPNEESHVDRLRKALRHSRKKLEPFRRNRVDALKQYVGKWYSDDGSDKKIPINLIELAIQIYARHLSARTPRILATTRHMPLKARAAKFQMGMNRLLEEINFRKTMNAAVKNALFSVGILKVGMNYSGTVEIGGYLHDAGQPYAENVDLDDFVFDTCAKDWEQIGFASNRYRIPLEKAKNLDVFEKDVRESLTATHKHDMEEDPENSGKAAEISVGEENKWSDDGEYQDYVEVEDVWLPDENILLTIAREDKFKKPLRIMEWDGPEFGPFHLLVYNDVPNNIMPLPPVALWRDLHDLTNQIWRKLANQAQRQKDVTAYASGNKDDARRIQQAKDGDMVQVDNPERIKQLKYGGIDAQNLMFSLQCRDLFSYLGGNLDSVGGLSAQADTLGQEQLLAASSSKRINDMQDQTIAFTKNVCRDLGQYLWNDPLIELPITYRLPATGLEVHSSFGPPDREGDFYQYNIDVEPHSMQDRGPQQRLQAIRTLVQELLLPLMPALQQSGMEVNLEGVLRNYALYSDMPELEELITFTRPPQSNQPGIVQPPMPAVTKRTYERVNRPGASTAGKNIGMMQTLMGSAQPKEAEGAARQVS